MELLGYTALALMGLGLSFFGLSFKNGLAALLFGVWPLNEFFERHDRPGLRVLGVGVFTLGLLVFAGLTFSSTP